MYENWTQKFNEARQARGLAPIKQTVYAAQEGMRSGCGCEIIRAGGATFTIRHRIETCRYAQPHTEVQQVVGDGTHNAVGSLFNEPDVLIMTMPHLGLFPHECQCDCSYNIKGCCTWLNGNKA